MSCCKSCDSKKTKCESHKEKSPSRDITQDDLKSAIVALMYEDMVETGYNAPNTQGYPQAGVYGDTGTFRPAYQGYPQTPGFNYEVLPMPPLEEKVEIIEDNVITFPITYSSCPKPRKTFVSDILDTLFVPFSWLK